MRTAQPLASTGPRRRHRGRWLLASACLLAAGTLLAQAVRIGYVDMKRLLDSAPQVIAARARLTREFAERDQRVKADEQRLADAEARQRREGALMSKPDADRLAAEIEALRRSNQRAREQLREELARRSKDELERRWPEIYGQVVEYAREQRYDLVLEAPVLYAGPNVDITDAVLARLKRVAAESPAPPP